LEKFQRSRSPHNAALRAKSPDQPVASAYRRSGDRLRKNALLTAVARTFAAANLFAWRFCADFFGSLCSSFSLFASLYCSSTALAISAAVFRRSVSA